jgi:hypothetical protein
MRQRCDGVTRRNFVRLGGLTALGLGLADVLRGRASAARDQEVRPTAERCVLIWLDGGPSHLETFDLKPDAPSEVRGPFQSTATSVPGIQICEHLPRTAALMDKLSLVRSLTSPLGEHNFGAHYMLTGYKPTPALEYPSLGSVVAHRRPAGGVLPGHVAVPQFRVGGGNFSGHGFLPESARPFSVGGDPAKADFQVRDLDFYPGSNRSRVERRQQFLQAFDRFQRFSEEQGSPAASDAASEQAYQLVTSPDARRAFRLEDEPQKIRQRYGPRTVGQSCLLARRLLERGVPFVTVNYPGWDTHQDLVTRLRDGYTGAREPVGLIPSLDLAFAALIEDLDGRGMLDTTLIVVMGEFGRTPKLNTSAGRDHWPRVFSVALAGGGVAGGNVVGRSDALGEGPADDPWTPADLAATLYHLLGIPARTLLHTPDGRPIQVSRDGQLIRSLLASG